MDDFKTIRRHSENLFARIEGTTSAREPSKHSIEDIEKLNKKLADEIERAKNIKIDYIKKAIGEKDAALAEELIAKVRKLGPNAVDDAYIQTVSSTLRKTVRSAPAADTSSFVSSLETQLVSKDASLEISLSEDLMKASATIIPAQGMGRRITAALLDHALRSRNVVYGYKKDAIASLLTLQNSAQEPITNIIIAEGTFPENGRGGRLSPEGEYLPNPAVAELEKRGEAVPASERYGARLVKKNELLAKLQLPLKGTPGKNVLGAVVPCADIPAFPFRETGAVRSTREKDDVIAFHSTIDGKAFLRDETIEVTAYRKGTFEVKIAPDSMSVALDCNPPVGGSDFVTIDDVRDELVKMRVSTGIDDHEILLAIEQHRGMDIVRDIVIARGVAPEHGDDAVLEVFPKKRHRIEEIGDRRISHKDLAGDLIAVKQGEVLAKLTREKFPKNDGTDVFGKRIPAHMGKTIDVVVGTNIQSVVDKLTDTVTYISAIAGQFLIERGREMTVSPLYAVNGDVDMSVGNIRFDGDVSIKGSIEDDYTVEVSGSLTVGGNIGSSRIVAGKNVIVGNGIITKDKGSIEAKGSLEAKFIENSNIIVHGDISVSRAILSSTVTARGSIYVGKDGSDRGVIVGGTMRAAKCVEANVIGVEHGTKTSVNVGEDYLQRQQYDEITEQLATYERYHRDVNNLIGRILSQNPDAARMPRELKRIYSEALSKAVKIQQYVNDLRIQESQLQTSLEEHINDALVDVGVIHPDVRVGVGKYQMDIHTRKDKIVLFFDPDIGKINYRIKDLK